MTAVRYWGYPRVLFSRFARQGSRKRNGTLTMPKGDAIMKNMDITENHLANKTEYRPPTGSGVMRPVTDGARVSGPPSARTQDGTYVSGIYALNLSSPDGTPGDWHYSAIDWDNIRMSDIKESSYGSWGIYEGIVPGHGRMHVADHIRACLDLIENGYFSSAGGMRDSFISDERYTRTIFDKVWLLRSRENWKEIDAFMGREYLCDWLRYKEGME